MSSEYEPSAEILWSGTDDWVSLAEAADIVRDERPLAAADLKTETMAVLDDLLRRNLIIIGDLSDGFQAWPVEPREAVITLDRRWVAPFDDVATLMGIWFSNTAAGDALAQELADAGLTSRPEDDVEQPRT